MRLVLSYLLWPLLFGSCLALMALGMATGHEVVLFNLTYLGLAVALFLLERHLPHERQWLENCGEMLTDLLHTLFNKGFVQILVVVVTTMGFAQVAASAEGTGLWPADWPLPLQVALGLVIAEFGLYWAHRLAHEWRPLWHFHAVHHSAKRLWFWNTGRFHFVDTCTSVLLSQPLLFLVGAPKDIFIWVSAATAFIGMLTHCNVEMRFGPLNYIFNTPALHRWHHSMDLREGNKNYGENLVLFDLLFGTYYNASYRPPSVIGVPDPMPRGFVGQLLQPFRALRRDMTGNQRSRAVSE